MINFKNWLCFQDEFQKTYYSEREDKYRLNVFAQNLGIINSHNYRAEKGLETFTMGINKFSDLVSLWLIFSLFD